MKLKVLLLGSGGRESALAWKLAQSPLCGRLLAFPGNPGMDCHTERVQGLDLRNHDELADWCLRREIDLVVIGPEQPLVEGLVDHLQERGIHAFGPSRLAAELEGSKAWAKAFMLCHNTPTARHSTVESLAQGRIVLSRMGHQVVLKADGLAAGKGVVLPDSEEQALAVLQEMLSGEAFGEAGSRVVIEERMVGPEISVFALCDGQEGLILGTARDFKRVGDGNTGPNTGGMGSLSPSPDASPELLADINNSILKPVIHGMADEGRPYHGLLYLGLMLTAAGPRVIEFNCRFGDPETQALLPLLDFDLLEAFWQLARGEKLARQRWKTSPEKAVCIVLASEGYPAKAITGRAIELGDTPADVLVFHAGTKRGAEGELLTAGGRVLNVVARGNDWEKATGKAYMALESIRFEGMQHRKDIHP